MTMWKGDRCPETQRFGWYLPDGTSQDAVITCEMNVGHEGACVFNTFPPIGAVPGMICFYVPKSWGKVHGPE